MADDDIQLSVQLFPQSVVGVTVLVLRLLRTTPYGNIRPQTDFTLGFLTRSVRNGVGLVQYTIVHLDLLACVCPDLRGKIVSEIEHMQ